MKVVRRSAAVLLFGGGREEVVLRTTPKSGILRATALLTWPGLTAPLVGPPLGGFLTEVLSWRAIFFVNLPLGGVGAILAWAWTPALEQGPKRPFDALGFALAGVALGAALAALDAAIAPALALSAIALVAGAAFVRHLRRARDAIVGFAKTPRRWALLGYAGMQQFFDIQLLGHDREVILKPNASFAGQVTVLRPAPP